jgi:hypothetical protein
LRRLDDFDTWWHLAAGRWIAGHRAIPATDTLSHTVRSHPWINLQWGFDLLAYGLHAAGGPVLLGLAAASGFTLAIFLILRLVRPQLGDAGGALLVLMVVLAAQDRFAVRPELLSFPLLALTLTILDYARTRDGRGSWLLVPLMVVWVNVHALFVVGAFAIACALAGSLAAPSRRLTLWGVASLAATLVNPFGARGALFPLKLLSRIDGSSPAFKTIGEFRSPFAADASGMAITAYKILLVLGVGAALASIVLAVSRRAGRGGAYARSLDYGGLLFFAGLAALSFAARRNAALFAVGSAPFIARSLGRDLNALPASIRERGRAIAPWLASAAAGAALAVGASAVTGAFYRYDGQPHEFGFGVIEGTFPIRAAAFAREARLPGKLYNDVAAGGYLAWDDPIGDGVFIDGRLEVYDTEFFSEYVAAMYDPARFEADADRLGIQTAIVYHHWENRRLLVERLAKGGVWSLVFADEVAAVFVRARGNDEALARAAAMTERWNGTTRAWLSRPVSGWRYPAGRVEGTRAFARLLATLDDPEGAVEAYTNLLSLHIPTGEEVDVRLILARRFSATGRTELARDQARRILALAPGNGEASRWLQ